jgi:IS30 family transposase
MKKQLKTTRKRGKFSHIKTAERLEIAILLKKQYSRRDIAYVLGRDHTSINREILRNSVKGVYQPRKAQHKARLRRRMSKYQGMKIVHSPGIQEYLEEKLPLGWAPDVIAGRLKEYDTFLPYVSAKTIYKWLYSNRGQYLCKYLASKQYYRKKRTKKTDKEMIPNRVGIEERPKEANLRQRAGDFENDLIVSGKRTRSKTALDVLISRKARFTKLRKISNQKAATHNAAVIAMSVGFTNMATITFDNGIENKKHEELSAALRVDAYFCNPYSSWEKGSVENINSLIRRWIPKGANIANYSAKQVQWIEDRLNHTPRKTLGYKTPYEVMLEEEALLPEAMVGYEVRKSLILKQKQHR